MKVEQISVQLLRAYDRNPRAHSKKQIRALAKSIDTFGFCAPVLIDDENQLIAGHGRVAAAILLGLESVPAIRLSHLTDAQKRGLMIADNRLSELATWNKEFLATELQALTDVGFEVEVVGFETAQIDLLLDEAREISGPLTGPEDDVPAYAEGPPVSRAGDVWQLSSHRLVCGDARDETVYAMLLEGDKAEFAITDAPYNVAIEGNVSGLGRIRHRDFAMASGEMSQAEFTDFLRKSLRLMAANTIDGSIHATFIDWRHMGELHAAGHSAYTELKNVCVWVKSNAGMGTFYRSQHELVFMWKSGSAPHVNTFELGQHGRSRSNVWHYAGANSFKSGRLEELSLHPTVKPVALIADAIRRFDRGCNPRLLAPRKSRAGSILRFRNHSDRSRKDGTKSEGD